MVKTVKQDRKMPKHCKKLGATFTICQKLYNCVAKMCKYCTLLILKGMACSFLVALRCFSR